MLHKKRSGASRMVPTFQRFSFFVNLNAQLVNVSWKVSALHTIEDSSQSSSTYSAGLLESQTWPLDELSVALGSHLASAVRLGRLRFHSRYEQLHCARICKLANKVGYEPTAFPLIFYWQTYVKQRRQAVNLRTKKRPWVIRSVPRLTMEINLFKTLMIVVLKVRVRLSHEPLLSE